MPIASRPTQAVHRVRFLKIPAVDNPVVIRQREETGVESRVQVGAQGESIRGGVESGQGVLLDVARRY